MPCARSLGAMRRRTLIIAAPLAMLSLWCGLAAVGAGEVISHTLKVRVFFIRSGQSCARVMDRCGVAPPSASDFLPDLERAAKRATGLAGAALSPSFGIAAALGQDQGCAVEVTGTGLLPGQRGARGAVVRVSDLYSDPLLTDCGREQSAHAGAAFVQWLKSRELPVHFLGSSSLARASETAYSMFFEPCFREPPLANCSHIFERHVVAQLPFLAERARPGDASLQADNEPRGLEEQQESFQAVHGRPLPIKAKDAKGWPRSTQQYEKFKAFLAAVVLPGASLLHWATQSSPSFREAVEEQLDADFGQPVSFSWEGGSYSTGPSFTADEWEDLDHREVNLVIVGHGQQIADICFKGQSRAPHHNAVHEKLYLFEASAESDIPSAHLVLREASDECSLVMQAPAPEPSLQSLTVGDVSSCRAPVDLASFLRLPPSAAGEATACSRVASGEDAYQIMQEYWPENQMDIHKKLRRMKRLAEASSEAEADGAIDSRPSVEL